MGWGFEKVGSCGGGGGLKGWEFVGGGGGGGWGFNRVGVCGGGGG